MDGRMDKQTEGWTVRERLGTWVSWEFQHVDVSAPDRFDTCT